MAEEPDCIFCKIRDQIPKSDEQKPENAPEFFFADDELFVISDNKPRAAHHYLVIPRQHIESAKSLTRGDTDLVKRMVQTGAQVLKDRYKEGRVDLKDIHLGFHWPPMTLIKHLHLHVIYPASQMSFVSRNLIFRSGFLFVTPDWLIERLQGIPDQ